MADLFVPAANMSKITTESYINVNSFIAYLKELLENHKVGIFLAIYLHNKQFTDIYNFVTMAKYLINIDQVSKLAFQKKCAWYSMHGGMLFVFISGMQKRYIAKKEVSKILQAAYNLEGHWQLHLTIKKLQLYYQLRIIKDIANYILGCI